MDKKEIKQLQRVIGVNLRKARLKVDLTQEELADKVGITTNYYARLERSETLPSLATLCNIAKVTKASVAQFVTS